MAGQCEQINNRLLKNGSANLDFAFINTYLLINERNATLQLGDPQAMGKNTIELSREDGEAICKFFREFWEKRELSDEEDRLYHRVIAAGNFGRPVRPHGSGPDNL